MAKRRKRRIRYDRILLILCVIAALCIGFLHFVTKEDKAVETVTERMYETSDIDLSYETDDLKDDINSTYAFVIDLNGEQILLDKQSEEQIYPASMTKILTAIVAIESCDDLQAEVLITEEMLAGLWEASVAGFAVGEKPTVEELLYAVALPSGADAANALAYYIDGSVSQYIERMNHFASSIGMSHSHFMNTTGLHDADHYTTCRDMGTLLEYCIQNPVFVSIFSTKKYTTHALAYHPDGLELNSTFMNSFNDDFTAPGLIGGKTGYTNPAGLCLGYWAENHDMKMVAITAKADIDGHYKHILDMSTILNYFDGWERKQLITEGDVLKTYTVNTVYDPYEVSVTVPDSFVRDIPSDANIQVISNIPDSFSTTLNRQEYIYQMAVLQDDKVVYLQDVPITIPSEQKFFGRVRLWFHSLFSKEDK